MGAEVVSKVCVWVGVLFSLALCANFSLYGSEQERKKSLRSPFKVTKVHKVDNFLSILGASDIFHHTCMHTDRQTKANKTFLHINQEEPSVGFIHWSKQPSLKFSGSTHPKL